MIDLVRARQERDLERLPDLGFTFDPPHHRQPHLTCAEYVRTFIESYCHHYKGEWAGQRFTLENWQYDDILRPIFGWKRPDGTRRFREAYVEVPRKNGKTILAAGIGLYLFLADDEPGAEVYCAATKEQQAKILWGDAAQMVEMSPKLDRMVGKHRRRNLHRYATSAKFDYLGADSKTQDGLNAHGILLDELHEHRNRGVYDKLTKSTGARRQPLTFIITTAGLYNPESIGWQKHDHAVKVLNGDVEDDAFFAFIACAAEDDDPFDEATWQKANPNYAVSKYPTYMEIEAGKAKAQPSAYNSFLRFELNIWTQAETRWLDAEAWKKCAGWQADPDELLGQLCYAGLDMSTTTDLTALALVFPEEWKVLLYLWCPRESILKRAQADGAPYDAWTHDGILTATSGDAVDYSAVLDSIVTLSEQYAVQELWFDPWNASQMAQELAEQHGIHTVQCRQGFASLNGPSKAFERLLYSGELKHGDNPALNWMASHVAKKEDPAGNIKPDKSASSERIDGIVALVMGIGAATAAEQGVSGMYDDDDPLVLEIG